MLLIGLDYFLFVIYTYIYIYIFIYLSASYLPMLALIGCCFVGCDRTLAMVMLCIAVGSCGTMFCGYMCSHADLAPRYAGTLMGITNTFATIPGFVSPILTGALTNDNVSQVDTIDTVSMSLKDSINCILCFRIKKVKS